MEQRRFAVETVEKLRAAGFQALWAGGCVRDLLLGGSPTDYDVATSATPTQVRELFGRKKTLAVGAAFGVIIVLGPKKSAGQVEVATFRTDADYSDGRRPDSVTFSTAEEDAKRRDFTINGMFYDPIQSRVIDYVGGQQDLERQVIRAIGNASDRIAEDKLRMLRAVRFAARFNFAIDPETRAAIYESAPQVSQVSSERICVEFQKTLETERATWAIDQWHELDLLGAILPELHKHWKLVEVQTHRLLAALPRSATWQIKMAAILWVLTACDGIGLSAEELVLGLRQRLRLSNQDTNLLRTAVTSQSLLDESAVLPWSQLQPLVVRPYFEDALELYALRKQDSGDSHQVARLKDRLSAVDEIDPPPLLDGQDLVSLGLRPGPMFKQLLADVRTRQLDGVLSTREEAAEWVQKFLQNADDEAG